MKRFLSALLLAMVLLAMLAPAAMANQDAIRSSCVSMFIVSSLTDDDGNNLCYRGSAFAVGKAGQPVKYFVTNRHVVENALETYIIFENSNNLTYCNVVAISDRADLAVVSLDSPTTARTPAVLRPFDIDKIAEQTEQVWVYGYPGVTDEIVRNGTGDWKVANTRTLTVTTGTISRVEERVLSVREVLGSEFDMILEKDFPVGEMIVHDAATSGGHSGGPTVDKDGYVIGVNDWASNSSVDDNHADLYGSVSVNEVIRLLRNEDIPYITAGDIAKKRTLLIALIAAGVVVIGAVVAILLTRKGKKGGKATGGQRFLLVCEAGDLAGRPPFEIKGKTTIGREKAHPTIAFPNDAKGVSGLHCTVYLDNGWVMVRDENSSYGTWIDGNKLQPGVPMSMRRGQKLYIGSQKQVFVLRG